MMRPGIVKLSAIFATIARTPDLKQPSALAGRVAN